MSGGNRNYKNGRAKEYRVVNALKGIGCEIAFRSAGSHSPIDVVGIDVCRKIIHLVQVKSGASAEREKAKALEFLNHLDGTYEVKAYVQ